MTPDSGPAAVGGMRLGHAESADGRSGVTAVVFGQATPAVVDHRGGASATYDIASLSLEATFGRRWAIFLAGGSIYGLDAAAGIREQIVESGGGQSFFQHPLRIAPVSGAALFDLPLDGQSIPDYRALGYAAAQRATPGPVRTGRVGAGAGATVGKYLGRDAAMPGGVGWSTEAIGTGRVGVLLAVNAVGAVRDPRRAQWVAGARGPDGGIVPPSSAALEPPGTTGTTLGLLVTDLEVERSALARAAAIVHAALGGVIVPFQTSSDGDILFACSTGTAPAPKESRPGALADELGLAGSRAAVAAALGAVRPTDA